jgi:flavin reductase (DIM6/NTAB) family NADH-FMN oxidoreductase RutF
MAVGFPIKRMIKKLLLGDKTLPQQVTVALHEPQDEIAVWLQGQGAQRDVTSLHSIACASPFTVCVAFNSEEELHRECDGNRIFLELRERRGAKRVLGRIGLRYSTAMAAGESCLGLFKVRDCVNYCMPRVRFWAHYLQQLYWQWRDGKIPNVRMSALDAHAMMVMFICPRPVFFVTTMEGQTSNLFPMNLMGCLGKNYFSLALNSERLASQSVKGALRVALSSIPCEKAHIARQLGKQHLRSAVDWNLLPFQAMRSSLLDLPVPEFALRVIEMEIQTIKELGSHTFFVARVLHQQVFAEGESFFMIHGIYQDVRVPGLNSDRIRVDGSVNGVSGSTSCRD